MAELVDDTVFALAAGVAASAERLVRSEQRGPRARLL